MAPEVLNQKAFTQKSDVYSFGILMLQLYTSNYDVFSPNGLKNEDLYKAIVNNTKPFIPSSLQDEIRPLIIQCLDTAPEKRPSFAEIIKIFSELDDTSEDSIIPTFTEYKLMISEKLEEKNEFTNADDTFLYGIKRYEENPTPKSEVEGMKYIQKAAQEGSEAAKSYLLEPVSDSDENSESESDKAQILPAETIVEKKEEIISLHNDNYFNDNENIDFNQIVAKIKEKANVSTQLNFDEGELIKRNFIFTEGANERLSKLYDCLSVGIPVLLEGPTGTSKTLSAEVVCKLMEKELIRFNLSSETKTCDLLGRYVGETNSWAGIIVKPGPFLQAFSQGKCLLLDEINLASPSVLQCIEEALDSGVISVEIPGMPLKAIKMHPEFRLIATQNPNKGLFANKRQDLGIKFLSRFQIINFPQFTEVELLKIGQGLAQRFGYNNNDVILQLVKFHMEWSQKPEIAEDIFCFTVREIAATVRALADGADIYDTIMTIYGARYKKQLREKLKETLRNYPLLNQKQNNEFIYPNDFPECFHNESLSIELKSIIFSFNNNRHVILTGLKGCGKTQLAKWVSEWYDKKHKNQNKEEEFFCICTEETKCSDLIGKQKPNTDTDQELIQWKPGFLTKAIQDGKCAVLDSIDEAPATVTERLNSLLDQKYDGEQKMFDIPENPQQSQIPIDKNFRLLCTCNIDKIHLISPAFLNRFDVIVLENQLNELKEEDIKELIKILMIRYNKLQKIKKDTNEQENYVHIEENDDENDIFHDENNENDENNQDDFYQEETFFDKEEEEEENASNETNEYMNYDQDENDQNQFEINNEIIDQVYNGYTKSPMSMYWLAFFCKAIVKYSNILPNNVQSQDIVEFAINMLKSNENFKPNKIIQNNLLNLLNRDSYYISETYDNQFFYKDSPPLCEFMAKIYAASIIGLPICVYGPTGAGKTSAARAFASIRPVNENVSVHFQMHSFHSGTKPNHFYGTPTIKNGKVYFHNGTLTNSMKDGLTFIADEMNLSTASCMKTLAPALEPCLGGTIFIPGVGESIHVNDNFFFIACQNELGTIGRNAIPDSISSRFRYFNYPEQTEEDISKICVDIAKNCYKGGVQMTIINETNAEQIGKYMIELNKLENRILPQCKFPIEIVRSSFISFYCYSYT
ncbi:Dynein heavy chain, cytoplasmic [Histomonas meleagridis]|uniref:Dynein heavy chain, cytoplasmic n=1 Tax=Histomonas meleagridis TaxID=135588 RepID=UPI00355AB59E|nr:Dynein heavy chain, cytoplasmic [Histomonas meleagridis]